MPVPRLLLLALLCPALTAQEPALSLSPISVERIWDRAGHNAFTDLIRYESTFYCAFREGSGHVPGIDGTVRVIASDDGMNWRSIALLDEKDVDLRDPKLSVMPDGRLMLVMAGSFYEGRKLLKREPRVAFSDPGRTSFGRPQLAVIDESIRKSVDWLWRVTWHDGVAYGVVYQPVPNEWGLRLVTSTDGVRWKQVARLAVEGRPNETTLRFRRDGTMIALVRREGAKRTGVIGHSAAPYTDWTWKELPVRLGGPNFVIRPDGNLIMGTRQYGKKGARTELARITLAGGYEHLLTLPSGGDTSYPGLVDTPDRLWVSYYSSHEGKTAIYLARVRIEPR